VIIDSSVLIAILRGESDGRAFAEVIDRAPRCRISAGTFLETSIIVDGSRDPVLSRRLDELINEANIAIEPVIEEHARIARAAYRDFGKGSGHPAKLSFGDCFAYALAKTTGEPLIFKGRGFNETDVEAAIT